MGSTIAPDGRVQLLLRLVRHTQRAHRPDHHPVAHRLELGRRKKRRPAKLGHVREQRRTRHTRGELAEHLRRIQRLRKNRVGARAHIELRPRHRPIHALAGGGVGARDDIEMPSGLPGGGHLGGHVMRIGEPLVVQMPTFLGQQLVLDMHRSGAGVLEAAHHVHHVQRLTVAGITVHQHRQAGGARHLANEKTHLVHGDDPEVRQPHAGRHGGTREIRRREPGGLRLQRSLAVMGAGYAQNARPRQQCPEPVAGGRRGQISGD